MNTIYHFTDTTRLPWIVATGELRPGRNQIGGYPVDFLWATTNCQGDRTAAGMLGYRHGASALVRIALHEEDFETWPDILERFPQWTSEHVRRLETAARNRGETNFSQWRCRAEPLPLTRVISIEAKQYNGNWKRLKDFSVCWVHPSDPRLRGVLLGDTVFASRQQIEAGKATQYAIMKMSASEWLRI